MCVMGLISCLLVFAKLYMPCLLTLVTQGLQLKGITEDTTIWLIYVSLNISFLFIAELGEMLQDFCNMLLIPITYNFTVAAPACTVSA